LLSRIGPLMRAFYMAEEQRVNYGIYGALIILINIIYIIG